MGLPEASARPHSTLRHDGNAVRHPYPDTGGGMPLSLVWVHKTPNCLLGSSLRASSTTRIVSCSRRLRFVSNDSHYADRESDARVAAICNRAWFSCHGDGRDPALVQVVQTKAFSNGNNQ